MNSSDPLAAFPLPAWLARAWQWCRAWLAEHPSVLDAAVVVLVALAFGAADYEHQARGADGRIQFATVAMPVMLLLQAGLVLPLFWRRRRPATTFYAVAAVFALQWSLDVLLRADVALLIALYSLVSHGSPRRLPWALATTVGLMTLVALRVSSAVAVWDALFFLISAATAAAALGLAVRIRRAQLVALRERAAQLEVERDQRSKLATATERTRVAREMHDIVGHSLSVIITLADGGAYATDVNPARGKEALLLISDTSRRALGELRRALGVLREQTEAAELSPQPGLADLGRLCERIRAAGPDIVYHTSGDIDGLDRGVQLAAYRIVQEALTNALKHAGPLTEVYLALTVDGPQLHVVVRDSGPPGDPRPVPPGDEGHGLVGMRERAALYGGAVAAGPRAGGGWSVEATLELSPPEPDGDPA